MKIHLYATDQSALELTKALNDDDEITALIVPANRMNSQKIRQLKTKSPYPVFVHHTKVPLDNDLPPASVAVSWLYSQVFGTDILRRYSQGMLNMHGGKIPQYRGASVLQWAIIHGEKELGITWHEIVEEVDAGAIWAECTIAIGEKMTSMDVRECMLLSGTALFDEAWRRFSRDGQPVRIPNLKGGRIWPQRKPSDGEIGPGLSEKQLRDLVRALCPPWPAPTIKHGSRVLEVNTIDSVASPVSVAYETAEGKTVFLSGTFQ
ncbi:MAG: formyltransferase family protein [Pseudomonadota bacterium]